ncbi:aromatic-ring-hydroxylating dioxygenase subunit beta [Pseudomonas aeruginosa]|jgi:p-cumate 2,3-dioxygenase beta subunit|nr:aromatic-ring-hydroxylating dioxygenase subunit beta [Pseudomonas aeruginosa]
MTNSITRSDIEDLFYIEADLLDSWKLKEWLALFTSDGRYLVPSADLPLGADPEKSLFYIADDWARLNERVIRLMKKTAHAEYPRSRTRHLVSNVMFETADDGEILARAAFVTYRIKGGFTDVYVGTSYYRLVMMEGQLRIREKRCQLDLENLRPHGRVSIIL